MSALRAISVLLIAGLFLSLIPQLPVQAQTNPQLILTKSIEDGVTTAQVGDTLRYRIRFECSSLVGPCGRMEITDVLPVGLIYNAPPESSVPAGFTMSYNSGTRTVTITKDDNNLLDGSQYDAVLSVTVDYDFRPLPQTITNTVNGRIDPTGTGTWLNATPSSAPPVTIQEVTADWQMTKTLASPTINPTVDTDVTYRLQLCPATSSGNVPLRDVTITDTLPSGAEFVSASNGGTESGGMVTWPVVAGPIYPPNCLTRYVTIRYNSADGFSVGDSVTNTATGNGEYTDNDGTIVPPGDLDTEPITHPIDPIVETPTYSKNDTGDPVGITGTGRFVLNLNTNSTNWPSNEAMLIDNMPAELEVMEVTSGAWDASFEHVIAYVEYSTDLGTTYTPFSGTPASYNSNTTYTAPAANITNVRWRFMYDPDGASPYTYTEAGLPYSWSFTTSPQIRITPRAVATTADDGPPGTVLPAAVAGFTYTNCLQVSRIPSGSSVAALDACDNENMTVAGNIASLRVSKAETPGTGWDDLDDPNINTFTADTAILPGDTVRYVISVELTERSSADLVNPTIQDTMPADLIFVRNGTAQLDGVDLAVQPNFTEVGDVLTWSWASPTPELIVSPLTYGSHTLTVEFFARVQRGQTPGTYTNDLIVVTDSDAVECELPTQITDTTDIDGDSNTTENGCQAPDTYVVERSAALRGEKWVRATDPLNATNVDSTTFLPDATCPDGGNVGLLGGGSNTFTRYPCIAQVVPEGALEPGDFTLTGTPSATLDDYEYNLRIFNDGNVPMLEYVLYDILPYVGDTGSGGTLSGTARDSEFRAVLSGPVEFISGPAGLAGSDFTIEYNETVNPCRPEVFNEAQGTAVPTGCDDTWVLAAGVSDWSAIRSYRIRLNNDGTIETPAIDPSSTSDEVRFGVPMYIPKDSPVVGVFDDDDAVAHEIAWNSFSHVGSYDKDETAVIEIQDLLASEPRKVGVTLPEVLSVGNRIWRDSDNSGTINGPDDTNPGIENVVVNLYRDTNQDGVPDGAAIASTLTDSEGYYLFSNIPYDRTAADENHYVIGIPASNFNAGNPLYLLRSSTGTPASTTYTTPTSNVVDSADDGIDPVSQGDEVFSYSFTLNPLTEPESESDLSNNDRDGPEGRRRGLNGEIDANSDLTIDFGFFGGTDIPFSIGNHVWYDNGDGVGGTINDGIRQAGEPPVVGVTVRLYRDGNFNGTPESYELVQYDITDANGFYLFDNLDPGPYYVEIPASQFAAGQPLAGWYSSQSTGTENVGVPGNTNSPSNDSDDNGIDTNFPQTYGVFSGEILLERGTDETLLETHISSEVDPGAPANAVLDPTGWDGPQSRGRFGETDGTSNLTVDFGFIPPMSLGNRVWIDEGSGSWNATDGSGVPNTFRTGYNNGLQDGTEVGVAGVTVQLWEDTNNNGTFETAGDTLVASTTTDASGYYLFDRLEPDTYFVRVPPAMFGSGQPLYTYVSSYDSNQTTAPADDLEDMDDNGVDIGVPAVDGVRSSLITMAYGTEPLTPANETDISSDTATYGVNNVGLFGQTDENSNITIDFGFVRVPRSIGNRVWYDNNNDGAISAGELPVSGVRVSLYLDTNNDDIPDDLGVIGNRLDDWIAYDITDADGFYLFDNLPPNRYIVGVDYTNFAGGGVLQGYNSSTGSVDNAANNVDRLDNGVDRLDRADATASPHGIISTSLNLLNTPAGAPSGEEVSGDIIMTAGYNPTAGDGTNSRGRNGELDTNSDLTLDFGFFQPMSLGNRVFSDNGDGGGVYNDGIMNGTEAGIAGVRVEIYRDTDANGVPDGAAIGYDITDTNGYYLFDNLAAGNYVVGIPASNFSGVLSNLISSYPDSTENTGVTGNPYTPTMDRDDNGINAANPASTGVFSGTIALAYNSEPGGETELSGEADTGSPANIAFSPTGWDGPSSIGRFEESDINSNITIDFGFVSPPRSLGNFLWLDENNNGVYDAGELPVPTGVRVSLYLDTDQDGQPDDLGTPGDRTDDWIRYDLTDASGYYLFDNLQPDYYLVGVDSSNFASGSLQNHISSSGYVDNASNNTDSLDNGVDEMHPATTTFGIVSTTIDLTPAPLNAPTGETLSGDTATTLGDNPTAGDGAGSIGRYGEVDANSDLTIDFGFFLPMSLGNQVFLDNGEGGGVYNDGIRNGTESGIANVRVELYYDDNADGVPEGLFGFDVTDANGYYLFDAVPEGSYVVMIAAGNFTDSFDVDGTGPLPAAPGALLGLSSSTPTGTEDTGVSGNPYTPNMDMDDNGINSGTPQTTGILSGPITLTYNAETLGETDVSGEADTGSPTNIQFNPTGWDGTASIGRFDETDANSNITVDFGFVPVFSLGNRVWFDTDNSSTINGSEVGIGGVTVALWSSDGSTEIQVGPDGILDTADDAPGGMLTSADGYYMFNNLLPGTYMVVLPDSNFSSGAVLEGYYSSGTTRNDDGSLSESAAALADSDTDSDDNGMLQTSGAFTDAVISSTVTLGPAIDAEPLAESDLNGGDQGQPDGQANMTVDFGFYTMQLGNLVWNDADNSGTFNSEAGIDGVTVELWSPSGTVPLASTTTAGGGIYSFGNLPEGNYFVRIPNTEFEGTETLRDFRSSTGAGNAYEPAAGPDALTVDDDDNGSETGGILGLGGYIQTAVFAMTAGAEQSTDDSTGMTTEFRVDFGVINGPQVDLAITKDDGQTYYIAGDTLTYTIVVTNNGPADVTGAEVADNPPAAITSWTWTCDPATPASYNCTDGTAIPFSDFVDLPYLGSITYTVEAAIDPAATGSLSNTATITAPGGVTETDTSNNSDTDTDLPAYLTIDKDDGVDITAPGNILTYHISIVNGDSVPLTSLVVTDTLPADLTFIRSYQGATDITPTSIVGNVITWDETSIAALGNLLPSGTIDFDIEVQVSDTPTSTSITNPIHIEDTDTGTNADDDDTDNILDTNSKTLIDTSESGSGTGSIIDPEPVFIGEILTYTTILEIPAGNMSNLQAVDILDRGLAFVGCVSITGGTAITPDPTIPFASACAAPIVSAEPGTSTASEDQGRRVEFDFGNVSSSSSSDNTITITYEVVVLDIADNYNGVDDLNNRITWTWDTVNSISASATPITIDEPQLTVEKTAQPTTATYGSTIDFTLEISHAAISAAPAYDVVLTDVLPGGLQYIIGSVTTSGLAPTSFGYDAATYTLTFNWDEFPLGATSTINFQAAFIGPSPVENEASLEWTSIEIDPQPTGGPVQRSPYNVNSTERWYDPLDQTINDYGAASAVIIRTPELLPLTGFIPGQQSVVPLQPAEKAYADLGMMYLEIPKLDLFIPITGIPNVDGEWDLTWLSDQAGYLEGSTFPGQVGNTAITAHVVLADGTPGPFQNLNQLAWGDQIIIHMDGQKYIYELRHNLTVYPNDFSTFYYDGYTWLTLITCEGYNEYAGTYDYRTLVKAVLVKTEFE